MSLSLELATVGAGQSQAAESYAASWQYKSYAGRCVFLPGPGFAEPLDGSAGEL